MPLHIEAHRPAVHVVVAGAHEPRGENIVAFIVVNPPAIPATDNLSGDCEIKHIIHRRSQHNIGVQQKDTPGAAQAVSHDLLACPEP